MTTSKRFAYFWMIVFFLLGVGLGWTNGEIRAQEYERQKAYVSANLARFEREAFYRGTYVMCRIFGELAFYASYDESIFVCKDIVQDGRDTNLRMNLYWLAGYEPDGN